MRSEKKCSYPGCDEQAQFVQYKLLSYCTPHYNELFNRDFEREWACWESDTQPSSELLNLLGRMVDERWTLVNGHLSRARLRDRGFNFLKFNGGFTFEITRHPGAFKNGYVDKRVVQVWKVSLQEEIAELVGERPWTKNDPD